MSASPQNGGTMEKIFALPVGYKVLLLIGLAFVLITVGLFVDSSIQETKLSKAQNMEVRLKRNFENKHTELLKLQAMAKQNQQIRQQLKQLVQLNTTNSNIDHLLKRITQNGSAEGLKFVYFKPRPGKIEQFYHVIPVRISVIGSYHKLARFISNITKLHQMISIDHYKLARLDPKKETLSLQITINVYKPLAGLLK